VRHVRMLGLCIAAVLAVGAALASSALALSNPNIGWKKFDNCPTSNPATVHCSVADTYKRTGGFYSVGPITVPVTGQILLQGGYTEEEETEAGYYSTIIPPEDGASAIKPVAEPIPVSVLNNVSEEEMNEFNWPQSLRESYDKAKLKGDFARGKTSELIEPAGADLDFFSNYNLLVEEGPAIIARVQILGENKWLKRLGGYCQIGSEANPIEQHLASGPSVSPLTGEEIHGKPGYATLVDNFEQAYLTETVLVDNTYAVPGAEKCGGSANEAYLDPVVNRAFGLPAVAGASTTELEGELYTATKRSVVENGA